MSGKARPLHAEKEFSDELFQSIFVRAADGIFVADHQGRYVEVNPHGCAMLGFTRQEILKLSIRDLIPPEDLSDTPLKLDDLRTGKTIVIERTLRRKDGTLLPVEVNANLLSNGSLLGIVRDISERKRAEHLLAALNRSAEAVADALTPDDVFSAASSQLKEAGIFCVVLPLDKSENFYIPRYLSIAPELLQRLEKLTRIKHEDFSIPIDALDAFMQARLENRAVFVENTESLVRQVLPRPLKRLASQIVKSLRSPKFIVTPMIADGNFYGIFAAQSDDLTERDLPTITAFAHQVAMSLRKAELFQQAQNEITERQHSEEILRKSEERYRSLFENMLDGFAYCRMIFSRNNEPLDFIYLDVNKAFERITGLKGVIGKRVTEVIPGIREANPELFEIYGNVTLTGKPKKFETYLEALGIWFSISVYSPEKDHFVAIVENITEHKQSEEILRKSEEKFRTVADFTYDWEYWVGVDGKHIYVSPSCERITGYRPDEFIKDHKLLEGIVHPEDHAIIEKHLQEGLESVRTTAMDFRIIRKDGEERWISHSCMPVFGAGGEWLGRRASNRDITDRKQAEKANEVLARFPAENPNPVLRITPYGQIQFANAASGPLLDEWGCEVDSFLPADWQALIAELVTANSRKTLDFSCKERVYSILIAPIRETGYVNLYGRDVTERVRAEEKVKKSEERYRYLFENNPHPMWVYELETLAFLAVNDAAIAKYGYTREEFLSKTIADIRPKEDLPRLMENLAQPRAVLEHSEDWRHRLKDGKIIDVEIFSHTLNLDEHNAALIIAQDVTERKKAEARVRYITRLYATLSQVNQTIVRVKQRDELFNAICDVAVEFGQFRMAWIGLLDAATGDVNPAARAGYEEGYLQSLNVNIYDDTFGNSPTGSAICTGKVVFIDDIETDPRFKPWRDQALKRDYRSSASVPIRLKGIVIGMLSLYATETDFFSNEELSLLEEIGMDISFALDMIETETQRKRAEEEIKLFRRLIDQSNDSIEVLDPENGRFLDVNEKACLDLGYSHEEFLSLSVFDIDPTVDQSAFRNAMDVLMKTGFLTWQGYHKRRDGSTFPVEVNLKYVQLDRNYIVSVARDISERKQAEKALLESERRYRRTLSNMMEGCQIIDHDWRYIYVNDAVAQQGHRKPDELLMHNMMEMYPGIEDTELFGILRVCMEERRPHRMENKFVFPDGTTGWFELSIQPVTEGLFILSIDITDRKKAENHLRASEDRYRDLVENSRELICTHDLEGRILSANNWALQMMDAESDEDLIGRNIADFIVPERRAEFKEYLDTIQREGRAQGIMLIQKANGERRVWEYNNSLRTDGVSTPIVRGMAIDVTESRQAEARLKASEEKYRSLFNNVPDGVFRTTIDGRLLAANPALVQMLGYDSAEELQAANIADMYFDPSERLNFIDRVSTENEVRNLEVRLKRKDGRQIIGLDNSRAVRDGGGTLLCFEGTLTDITERKRAEEEIRSRTNELSTLYDLSRAIANANDLDKILELVNRHAVKSVRTTFARIALLEGNQLVWRAAYPMRALDHDLFVGEHMPITALPYCQHILEQDDPAVLRSSDPEIGSEERMALLLDFTDSLCLIPLRVGDSTPNSGQVLGLLMLGEARSEEREPFTSGKVRLARNIGDQVATAINRMLLREQTERRLQHLTAMSEIDRTITSSFDLRFSLGTLLTHIIAQLNVDAADVLLFNPDSQTLDFFNGRGFRTKAIENGYPLRLGEGCAGRVALERHIVHIANLNDPSDQTSSAKNLAGEDFVSYYGIPLIAKRKVKGVLEVYHRAPFEPDEEWLYFLTTFAEQAAIAIDNLTLFNDLQRSNSELMLAYETTLEGWSRALDLRDKETEGHTQRVTEMTVRLARTFGMTESQLVNARRGGLLHDIGKMGVPDSILLKPGELTEEEWKQMRMHPIYAYDLLSHIAYLHDVLNIPYCHHEKWDGTGYPRGLKGEEIPLAARIFAIVDVWDALTSDRPYRKAWTKVKALKYIKGLSGTHFDPLVVKAFFESKIYELKKKGE